MPLALELATARLRSMSLTQLHDRLEHRFGLLTGGQRTALARQQTLAATVDWSYDLLSESEQALFRRASVFVDGFDLEAAEGVCALANIAEWEIADLLASLVDKSLVVAEPFGRSLRYRLQETLREYGAERLAKTAAAKDRASEAELVIDAHANYYLTNAERAELELQGRHVRACLGRLDADDLNLRAAIEHALGSPQGAARVLRQFWATQRYWGEARHPVEALSLIDRALARVGSDLPVDQHARALYCKAVILFNVDRRKQLGEITEALDLARAAGNKYFEADTLAQYSRSLVNNGRSKEAIAAGDEAMALAREFDDALLLGAVLFQYATVLHLSGSSDAEAIFLEGLAHTERTGDAFIAGKLHNNYSIALIDQGNLAEARRHLEISLELGGVTLTSRNAPEYNNLAAALLKEGDAQRAEALHIELLRYCRLNGMSSMIAYSMSGLACCATRLGRSERAAVLHGGADAILLATADVWEHSEAQQRARDMATLRERMGEEFERLYKEGLATPHDLMIKLALTKTPSP